MTNSFKKVTFNNEKFAKDVYYNRYALVIGNESILNPSIEPTGDVHQYFLRKVNERYNTQYKSYHEIALDKYERINPLRQQIEDGYIKFDAADVSKDLMALIETRLFTTILTTTTDGYLEAALRKVWGSELRIVNIYDKETVDELQKALNDCRSGREYNQPTLIYVFGKLDVDDIAKKYIRTDADAILLIEKWMEMKTEQSKNVKSNNDDSSDSSTLIDYVRSKRLLALGCKYDNWYFRFFWHVLTGVDENTYDGHGHGEVAFNLDKDDKAESKLQEFLDRNYIYCHGDATPFIPEITKILTDDTSNASLRNQVKVIRSRGGIFISYCSKDALTARQLFFKLCEMKYNVWLDSERLYGGDNYEQEIYNAISDSKVVITVLSPHVADDLTRNDTNHYYNKEWRIAQQFKDKAIIPLAINGYDPRSGYHKIYDSIINQPHTTVDLMASNGLSTLITSIENHLL